MYCDFFLIAKYTGPVIETCDDCSKPYRTYIPGADCILPDGGLFRHHEPQLKCPECDPNGFGQFMNEDLFPMS